MAEARETRVFYKAIADFSNLKKELREIDRALAKTAAAEKALNAQSATQRNATTKATNARVSALRGESAALKDVLAKLQTYKTRQVAVTGAVRAANKVISAQNRLLSTNAERLVAANLAAREYAEAQRKITRATGLSSDAIRAQKEFTKAQKEGTLTAREHTDAVKKQAVAFKESNTENIKFVNGVGAVNKSTGEVVQTIEDGARKISFWKTAMANASAGMARFRGDGDKLPPVFRKIESGGSRAFNSLERFGNWRPRLIPPFVALIPIIGAVIAALNPLVALLGAIGGAAIGLAGQIGSLSGAFVALPGILSGVVAGIAGVIASMGGVGNVFKTYSAMQKAIGAGANTGESQADRADRVASAERNLARAQRSVQKAQENLNRARADAIKDLEELRIAVSRASLDEERAIANLVRAREEYNNVLAEPASTAGDKLDAAVRIKEAEADLADVRRQNVENREALTAAEVKGVEQSDRVLDAQDALTSAIEAQQDAQRGLNTEQSGGSAAITSINEYQAALDALSPSARTVVLALIGLQDQWKAMRLDLQENFFSEIVGSLDRLPQAIENISKFLAPATKQMGAFTANFLELFTSPAWNRDLATIGEQNGEVVKNLGDGFLALADFMKSVMVAAGPFTDWMTNGFARGSENMARLLDTDEERGRFANWLTIVEERLRKWWDIVKNIGKTIFNYSAAAADFGDWISDRFLKMTENWRKASENARKPNSEFRQWLDNIQPLLTEVNKLLGAFFGWFASESAEVGNIKSAENLVRLLRDDLGPALGRFLDTLAATEIDETFVRALTTIIESLDTVMERGGAAALESFFEIVTGAFEALAAVISAFPESVLRGILGMLGTMAAITFVGKFTGLTALLGALTGSAAANAKGIGGAFAGLSRLKFVGVLAVVSALVELPGILKMVGQGIDKLTGVDVEKFNELAKNYQKLSTADDNTRAMRQNMVNDPGTSQIRNWVADQPKAIRGDTRQWLAIDDALKKMLDEGNIEGFRSAWSELNRTVGKDTPILWADAKKKAEELGLGLSDLDMKTYDLGIQYDLASDRLQKFRDKLTVNTTAMSRTQAVDAQTAAMERLAAAAAEPGAALDGTNEASRNFRAAIQDAETASRQAADAILADGGTVEEASVPYSDARQKIIEYAEQLGMDPGAAQAWADNQFGPVQSILDIFTKIYEELTEIDKLKNIEFTLRVNNTLGIKPNDGPMTKDANGKDVFDFGANGKQNGSAGSAMPGSKTPNLGLNAGTGGGGFGLGLASGIKEETEAAKITWDTFWRDFNNPTLSPMDKLKSFMLTSFSYINSNVFEPFKTNSANAFNWIKNNVFIPFQNAGSVMEDSIGVIASGMGAAWSSIQGAFSGPVNWVIEWVWNRGLRSFWNDIAARLGLNGLPWIGPIGAPPAAPPRARAGSGAGASRAVASGGVLDHFGGGGEAPYGSYKNAGVLRGWTPGTDVHTFTSPTGGKLKLSGGEAIMRPEFTKMVGGEEGVKKLNKAAMTGGHTHKFADGGVFGKRKSGARRAGTGGPWDDFMSSMNPAKWAGDAFNNLLAPLLRGVSDDGWTGVMKRIPGKLVEGTVKKVSEWFAANPQGAGGPANAMGWQRQWAAVKQAFPWANLNDAFRPGDPNYHGKGRAVDLTASMEIFNWIRSNYPNSRELIYSPANGRQLLNGENNNWPSQRAYHWDHVHWAMNKGGTIPEQKGTHDSGGWLQHGQAGLNMSGKPEAFLTYDESMGLKRLLTATGLSARPAMGATPANLTGGGPGTVIDNSVNVHIENVNNPVPEPVSETIPKSIRSAGYLSQARNK